MTTVQITDCVRSWSSRISTLWVTQEIITVLRLAIPISLTLLLQQLPILISLLFVGWISNTDSSSINLDAASLGTSFVNITGIAVIIGLSSAADTLCSQTFGFKNYKRVGVIFQRGLVFQLLVSMFIICVWLNTESLLLLLQQKPCVARYTALYVNIFIIALPFVVLYTMLQKFLQTQSIVWPFIITGVLTNIINVIAHAVLIFGLGLGIGGASAGLVIANVFQPLILIVYVKIRGIHKKTWGGWSLDSLEKWPEFIKLAVPGMTMVIVEWASFEIASILLGTISEVELAVNGILIAYATFVFMIPYGISVAVSIRVGNELGAGNVKQTKRAIIVSLGIMIVCALVVDGITFSLRNYIGAIYNVDEEVNNRLKQAVYVLFVSILFDQIQAVLSGIVRGAGHQFRGAIINIVAFYVFGLPIGITLAIVKDMGVVGIWIGLTIAVMIQSISYSIVLLCLNWPKEAMLAMKRGQGTVTKLKKNDSNNTTVELKEYNPLEDGDHGNDNHGNNDDISSGIIREEETDGEDLITATNNTDDVTSSADNNPLINDSDNVSSSADNNPLINDYDNVSSSADNNPLINDSDNVSSSADNNPLINNSDTNVSLSLKDRIKGRVKIIFCHCILVIIAIVCLIVSGILSIIHPPDDIINGNYSDCTSSDIDNITSEY